MGIIYTRKIIQKHSPEASPRPFHKKSKLNISLHQKSDLLYSLILLFVKVEVYQKDSSIKGHSANVSVKINGKTGRSLWKNCCY